MVATVIHFYFKSMPSFGWDPERQKNETGGREKSLARGKEESELSPSVLLQEARKDWKFKRRSSAAGVTQHPSAAKEKHVSSHRPSLAASTRPALPHKQ